MGRQSPQQYKFFLTGFDLDKRSVRHNGQCVIRRRGCSGSQPRAFLSSQKDDFGSKNAVLRSQSHSFSIHSSAISNNFPGPTQNTKQIWEKIKNAWSCRELHLCGQGLPQGSLITVRNDASRFNKCYLYRNFSDDRKRDGDIAASCTFKKAGYTFNISLRDIIGGK